MKKLFLFVAAAAAALSCRQMANDLVHEEVPAEILAFEVEGQISSEISRARKTVTVTVPGNADMSALTISRVQITQGASCTPALTAGSKIDLSSPKTFTLTTYDPYIWTIEAKDHKEDPQEGPQLYNMGFDHWCTAQDKYSIQYDALFDEDANETEKATWASAGSSTKMMGYDSVIPETEFLAVPGQGKKALKLKTCGISALFGAIKKLAAGSVFVGYTGDIDIAKMSAHIFWGVSFTARPKALEGYYCYKPVPIDWAKEPYLEKKGQMDIGSVAIILSDWETPYEICPPEQLLDAENNPGIIGYGKLIFDKEMTGYEPFHIDITYRNERTPKYISIVCSSSDLGDYFTGGDGSVLYLDEFKLTY